MADLNSYAFDILNTQMGLAISNNITKIFQEDVRLRRALYGKFFEDISYLYHYLEADIVNSDYNPC